MASSSSKKKKKNNNFLMKEDRPSFFKIILYDSIPLHKLGIPRKFVKLYGDYLSNHAMLKVPSCGTVKKWRVKIVRDEGQIWLQNGWREFAEHYSVVEGSFLVFEFEKSNCEFNVIIFDKSATEIDYPLSSFGYGDSSNQRANLDDEEEEQVPNEPIKKKIKLRGTSANTLDQYCPAGRQKVSRNLREKKALINEGKSTSVVRKSTANLQSQNPSFRIVMQPSFLYKRRALVVPSSFAKNYLNKDGDAALKVLDGRTWFVNYYSKKILGITKTRIEHFGWNKFVQDNHLDVGDVCVFELINHVRTTFRVTISKSSMPANVCTLIGNSTAPLQKVCRSKEQKLSVSNRREATEAAKKNTSANPSFEAQISASSLRNCTVHVQSSFISKIAPGTKFVRLKVNNRCWSVKLIMNPEYGTALLSAGWVAFARENSLKVGDVCTYRLINNTDQTPLINVSIIRGSGMRLVSNRVEGEEEPQVPRKRMKVENFTKETGQGKSKQLICRESGAIECIYQGRPSLNPFFKVVMTSNHINGGGTVHVPSNFIKNLEPVTRIAQLQVDNRLWSLRLNIYPHHKNKSTFSRWIPFARANSLKVGDVCSFELIDARNLVVKVSISRDIIHV